MTKQFVYKTPTIQIKIYVHDKTFCVQDRYEV